MLKDPREIEIISRARQKNVRDPSRSRGHFEHIFDDFLSRVRFAGARFLDLGPGQFDFAEMARKRGAVTTGIDNDPAVCELGHYKKLEVRMGCLKRLSAGDFAASFDGVFCKFSINAFWFWQDDAEHRAHVAQVGRLVTSGGWSWIGPWNGVPDEAGLGDDQVRHVLSVQAEAFKEMGFHGFDLTEKLSKRYGVHGTTANRAVFVLNLEIPSALKRCARL